MGTSGMNFSLQSRDLIADAVETVAGGHWLDGMVVIPVRRLTILRPHFSSTMAHSGLRQEYARYPDGTRKTQ